MAQVPVSVGMTPAMIEKIDEEWQRDARFGSRGEYIRACVRADTDIQLPIPDGETYGDDIEKFEKTEATA